MSLSFPEKMGKFLNISNSHDFEDSTNWINYDSNITSSFGGIFPILIINLFSFLGSSDTNIAAFPEEILSVYLISAFSFLITFDLTLIESPILASKEEKMRLAYL